MPVKAPSPGPVEVATVAAADLWTGTVQRVLDLIRLRPFRSYHDVSQCPRCGRPGLRRSAARFYEKPRKFLTADRPYRCGGCRLRVWGRLPSSRTPESEQSGRYLNAVTLPIATAPLDLSALDHSLEREQVKGI